MTAALPADLWKTLAAPLLAVLAAALRLVPAFLASSKPGKLAKNDMSFGLRVHTLQAMEPWPSDSWPQNWNSTEERIKFRKNERLWIRILFSLSLILSIVYAVIFFDDKFADFITFHQGNGIPAATGFVVFFVICIVQSMYWFRIRGGRGLEETLYGAHAQLEVLGGGFEEMKQYSLGLLDELGSRVVSCTIPDAGGNTAVIEAATGLWPPRWLNTGPLKLISIRGQRIAVHISSQKSNKWTIRVVSDNMDPGVDESRRANKRNVNAFVKGWVSFPLEATDAGKK